MTSQSDRIVAELKKMRWWTYDGYNVPWGVTASGLSDLTGISRGNILQNCKTMELCGMLVSIKGHPTAVPEGADVSSQRVKAYILPEDYSRVCRRVLV